jgi:hypothetical protein
MKGRATMEIHEQEQMYWTTVNDVTDLLVYHNTDVDTFLGDVLDSVLRVSPDSRQAAQMLGILAYFSELDDREKANIIVREVLDADSE